MRHMKTVHSRIGVTFTALVEIAVSTVTSLSVCALVGFKVTMVPWCVLRIANYIDELVTLTEYPLGSCYRS